MMDSYSSPLLALPGAVDYAAQDSGFEARDCSGVAWHYGDPLVEQRRLVEARGPVVVDRSHRVVVEVSGKDAASFLHGLLSQKLVDATPGFFGSALNLDAQGRIVHALDVVATDSGFFLDIAPSQAESFVSYLQAMVFWSEVRIEVRDLAVLSVFGVDQPPAALVSRPLLHMGLSGWDVLVPRAELMDVVQALGAEVAGYMAFTAQRVRAGLPELSLDADERMIPHEAPLLIERGQRKGFVHLDKGCYRGQETVARVENLGRAPRILAMVHLDGSTPELPEPGSDIVAGTRRVGRLGTVVHDFEYGPIALALIKRSALHGALQCGDASVQVDEDSLPKDESSGQGRNAVQSFKTGGHHL